MGTDERARLASWRLGNPWWVGPSDRIEYRLRGKVTRLRAYFVWSPPAGVPARTLQKAGSPAIVPRSGWNADEKIRRSTPAFASAIRLAVVHHTAGANGYTAAQSPSIVRAIELYHVKGNGWNDIGYNFLDRPLRDGLRGPVRRHRAQRRRRARRGLQHRVGRRCGAGRVQLARRLGEGAGLAREAARLAPRSRARRSCEHAVVHLRRQRALPGRPAGLPPHGLRSPGHRLHGLSGDGALQPADHDRRGGRDHRPAEALRARRHGSGARAPSGSKRGSRRRSRGPSTSTTRSGTPSRRARDSARTSTGPGTRRWRRPEATRTRSARTTASRLRSGRSAAAAPGAFSVSGLAADPETVTPNDDTVADETTITYTLSEPGNVTVTLRDASGALMATIANKAWKRAGEHAMRFDPADLPDGVYQIEILATATGARQATASTQIVGQPDARQGHRRPARVLAQCGRPGGSDRVQLRARRPGADPAADPQAGQVGRDALQGPARAGHAEGRVGRRQAGRSPARRRVRGGRRGDRRVRDHDGRGAVQCRHARAQGQDPPAQPAEALAQRAGDGDAALRHAAPGVQRPRRRRGARPEGAEAGARPGGCLGRCGQQKQACLPR